MSEAIKFLKSLSQPHRRAALLALLKASVLLGALSELGWILNVHYFSRYFPQLPISLAWSMLTVIFLVTGLQMICSIVVKMWSTRQRRKSSEAVGRITDLLTAYISGEDSSERIERAAENSPKDFESCIAMALLGLRGSALRRLRELPGVRGLRESWMVQSRTGDEASRCYAVEQLALLRDESVIPALEIALEDPVAGVVAAAVRGLMEMPSYGKREDLLRSLPERPYLVRVLTARGIAPRAAQSPERESCSALAALGATGRDLLLMMSAVGEAGDAPAEALSESLVEAARGGRI